MSERGIQISIYIQLYTYVDIYIYIHVYTFIYTEVVVSVFFVLTVNSCGNDLIYDLYSSNWLKPPTRL